MIRELSLEHLAALANAWLSRGGMAKVELAAMEPTLWRQDEHTFLDLIHIFAASGFQVNLTSNGSTLVHHTDALAHSPINKIRISWHSLDPQVYKKITGGNYIQFIRGIEKCMELGIDIVYNRVLLRGLTSDIPKHIELIDRKKKYHKIS